MAPLAQLFEHPSLASTTLSSTTASSHPNGAVSVATPFSGSQTSTYLSPSSTSVIKPKDRIIRMTWDGDAYEAHPVKPNTMLLPADYGITTTYDDTDEDSEDESDDFEDGFDEDSDEDTDSFDETDSEDSDDSESSD